MQLRLRKLTFYKKKLTIIVLYTGSNTCSLSNGGCQQLCLPVGPGKHVCKCTAGFKLTGKNQCTGRKTSESVVLCFCFKCKLPGMEKI